MEESSSFSQIAANLSEAAENVPTLFLLLKTFFILLPLYLFFRGLGYLKKHKNEPDKGYKKRANRRFFFFGLIVLFWLLSLL